MTHPRPFRRQGILGRIGPFVACGVLALGTLPLVPVDTASPLLWTGLGLIPVIVALALVLPWERWPGSAQALPPLTYLLIVALLRDATGAHASPLSPLVLLVVIWFALHGTRRELLVALLSCLAALGLPTLSGAPRYPMASLADALVLVLMGALVGISLQVILGQRNRLIDELERLSLEDPLTGLVNRREWDRRLPEELARARRGGYPVAVVSIDMDHFKEVNDRQGHQAGDDLLRQAAHRWRTELRANDLLARVGGDEFVVVLPHCTPALATALAKRLQACLPSGHTCSAGVAQWDGDEPPAALVRRADQALLRAKAAGRNTIRIAGPVGARLTVSGGP